ncbi:hypothetical protein FACS189445_1880 [Spirochaetia bacterium]|nr:hypothetical protein FACS189445_1880 [Spirochaetia bacterium]
MSRRFHTTVETISSDISEYQEITGSTKNDFSETIHFNQYSRIESNEDFFGIRFTEGWFNPKRKAYTLLAYIKREEAEKLYHARIETNMDSINALMSRAAEDGDPLFAVKLLETGRGIADMTTKYIDTISFIYPEKNREYLTRYAPYLNTVHQLYAEHEKLRNTRINVTVEFRGTAPLGEADKNTLRQSIQDAIGEYNVPVEMRTTMADNPYRYAFVITLDSGSSPSGLVVGSAALTFTRNGETLPVSSPTERITEQNTEWFIRKAAKYIRDNRGFYQALIAELNR